MFFSRKLSESEVRNSHYMKQALNPVLYSPPSNSESFESQIALCEQTKDMLVREKKFIDRRHHFYYQGYQVARGLRHVIDPLAKVVVKTHPDTHRIPQHAMGIKALDDVRHLFRSNSEICANVVSGENPGYHQAINILDERIKHLKSQRI